MTRAVYALRCAVGLALIAWWAPSLLLLIVRLAGETAWFGFVMVASRALGAIGLHRTALRVCEAERDRVAAKMAAVRARRRW